MYFLKTRAINYYMIYSIATLIGGIGVFIFSIYLLNTAMSDEFLKKSAFITGITDTPIKSLLCGFFGSMLTQSSSAINSVAVQLADKGLLTKNNRYYLVMGTNVGTTITAYLAVLGYVNTSALFMLLLPIFAIILAVGKIDKLKKTAFFVCSFLMLFLAINNISSSIPQIVSQIDITCFTCGNKLKLLLLSSLITAACQSSSVVSIIIVMLGNAGSVDINNAIFLIMGANIGTCITAFIASIGKSKKARKIADFNLLFNIVGVLVFTFAYYTGLLNTFLKISVSTDTKIALFHTMFNLLTIPFVIPFIANFNRKRLKIKPE